MSEKQTYTVATKQPLAILGRLRAPGSTVTLHPKQAAAHLRTGALVDAAATVTATKTKTKAKATAATATAAKG